jgi:hypothetical protein
VLAKTCWFVESKTDNVLRLNSSAKWPILHIINKTHTPKSPIKKRHFKKPLLPLNKFTNAFFRFIRNSFVRRNEGLIRQ